MKPPLPENEDARLAALRRYQILDTAPEDCYNDIVSLAAHLIDAPIAAISLIDADRQWFKARVGLTEISTPREQAFCAHTILQNDVMEVQDARADSRFADNALVAGDPRIRFYAGAPLVTPVGEALGSICVIDQHPRKLTPEQKDSLKGLARMVMRNLEYRSVCAELAAVAANLKTLSGLLPICSWCKKVRNDDGYWQQVETYIKDHSAADFTHGICPECRKSRYPTIKIIR
jgi:hypothetical protein